MKRQDRYEFFFSVFSKILVWGALFGVVYLLRSFSLLMFLVFVFSYIQSNTVNKLAPWIKSRPARVTLVGSILLASLILAGTYLVPQFRQQATGFVINFSTYARNLDNELVTLTIKYPILAEVIPVTSPPPPRTKTEWDIRHSTIAHVVQPLLGIEHDSGNGTTMKSAFEIVGSIGSVLLAVSSQFLLSLLFSFLIVYDLPNLTRGLLSLRHTKLSYIYEEVSDSLLSFGRTLGRAFEAQIQIAIANTIMTAVGVWLIGIRGDLAFISLIVFFCSFVPIAGVFISSIPICLLALQQGGLSAAMLAIGMILAIHMIEAYILNPKIFGHHLRLNTVLVLILVTVSGKIFGVWGLVLCLPIATYIFQDAIQYKEDPATAKALASDTVSEVVQHVRPIDVLGESPDTPEAVEQEKA